MGSQIFDYWFVYHFSFEYIPETRYGPVRWVTHNGLGSIRPSSSSNTTLMGTWLMRPTRSIGASLHRTTCIFGVSVHFHSMQVTCPLTILCRT